MGKSTKPSGLSITRSNNTYTCKWKIGDKNYGRGQNLQYSINGGKWQNGSVGKTTVSFTIPGTTATNIKKVAFRVQGRRSKYTKNKKKINPGWSDWATKEWAATDPKITSLTYTNTATNAGIFKWEVNKKSDDTAVVKSIKYYSTTVPGSGKPSSWGSGTTTSESSSKTETEDTTALANGNFVRWFRIEVIGANGKTVTKDSYHAYGAPSEANLTKASAADKGSYTQITAEWTDFPTTLSPIDTVTAQYIIAKPTTTSLSAPSGTWTDAIELNATKSGDKAVVNISDTIDTDECMWVRIMLDHDGNVSYSNALLAQTGVLDTPTISATPNTTTGAVAITITEETACTVACTAIFFRSEDDPSNDRIIAIFPNGTTTGTITVSDIVGASTTCFGAFAFVGTYSGLSIDGLMYSEKVIDSDIVPVAPASVTVTDGPRDGTVRIWWTWTWTDAVKAELAWADHEEAWESTDEPQNYEVIDQQAVSWVIADLDAGTWYFRVRLIGEDDDEEIVGPWSTTVIYSLSTVPDNPFLTLSKSVINEDDTVTARWAYSASGDAEQAYAEVAIVTEETDEDTGTTETVYTVIAHTDVSQSLELAYDWETDTTYNLSVRITTTSGMQTAWSELAALYVAEPVEMEVSNASLLLAYTATDYELESSTVIYLIDEAATISEYETDFAEVSSISVDGTALDTSDYSIDASTGVITFDPEITVQAGSIITITGYRKTGETESVENSVLYTTSNLSKYYEGSAFIVPKGTVVTYYLREVLTVEAVLMQIPISVTVTGAGETGTTILSIARAEDYHLDRPDERDYDGYAGETIYTYSQTGEDAISVTLDDLIGHLDDGAQYTLIATVIDDYGQSASEEIPFTVNWTHKAGVPGVEVSVDKYLKIAKITPVAPSNYVSGDVCDIYRLTADKPELIYEGAAFGTTYVDPYPGIGEMCGHRLVTRTANGDYATSTGLAWYDADANDGDLLEIRGMTMIIDVDGDQIELPYNIELTNSWNKDFLRTSYLGGSVQGDWNPAVTRDLSARTVLLRGRDLDKQLQMRGLSEYAGLAHIKTCDGSSLPCDIQVRESIDYKSKRVSYTLTVQAVDPEGMEGMTLDEWEELNEDES